MSMHRSYARPISGRCGLAALGAALLGLAGCQSGEVTQPGVIPSTRLTFSEAASTFNGNLVPDWLRMHPPPGTLLSADETYLREFASDIAAPDEERVSPWRRPIYRAGLSIKLGPPAAQEQNYYYAQSLKWHASEEARVNVLLADLHRANARLNDYSIVADRILDIEDERMRAIHDSDLIMSSRQDLEKLVAHSIANRQVISHALQSIPGRITSYAYAAKRARIDLPGSADHYNVEAQIASLAHRYESLQARVDNLDQQITDVLSQPVQAR